MTKIKENKHLIFIFLIFILSRLLFIFFIIKNKTSIFKIYDEVHYLKIAQYGYTDPELYAFFPFYPLLIRLLSYTGIPYNISGIIISNISTILSLIIIYKLCDKNKFETITLFLLSPILAFTTLIYTESLYLFLTLFSFYLYKKNRYISSAIFTGLSTLTRNSGIILLGSIGLDMLYRLFKKKDIKISNIIMFGLLSLMIGIIYPIFLYINTGDFFKFITVQKQYWFRNSGYIILTLIKDIEFIINKFNVAQLYIFIQNWSMLFIGLILGIKLIKKDIVSSMYILGSLVGFTLTYRTIIIPTSGLFRYVLGLFPIYLYIFELKTKNKYVNILLVMVYIILAYCNAIIIYSNYFIA